MKKNSTRKTLQNRRDLLRARNRMGVGQVMRTSLSTSQGMSTLKIVIMYSVLGMILNWLLPIVLLKMNPEMFEEDAQYFGTLGAIVITGFFLIVSLLKRLILRSRSHKKQSESRQQDT